MASFRYPPRVLEFAPGLAALADATVSQPAAAAAPAAPAAAAAAARGAPVAAGGAGTPRPRRAASSALTIPGYESPVPAGLAPMAGKWPAVMSGSAVYSPHNLPTGRTLNFRPTLTPQAAATLGSGMGFAGLGDPGVGNFLSTIGRIFDPTITGSVGANLLQNTTGVNLTNPQPPPQQQPMPTNPIAYLTPQNQTQKYLLYGAGALGLILVASIVMRSRGGAQPTIVTAPVAGW